MHDPPHFHVKRDGEWELKVNFIEAAERMFELQWGDPPKSKTLKQIAKTVREHRGALLAEWEQGVSR
ncbi:MAG: DUF4160 domain-containing protein [Planctomycetes bacterium]|nr:DUF4160 domain-containing protein [Planctomycetota bacterium]